MDVKTTIQWATPYSIGTVLGLAVAALAVFAVLRRASGGPIAPARRAGLRAIRATSLAVLVLILINPVRVDETPGTVERAQVAYLVDSSQSMGLGKGPTRWEEAAGAIRDAERLGNPRTGPHVNVFRFGSRLAAVEAPFWRPAERSSARVPVGTAQAAAPEAAADARPAPTDPDTLLSGALEALAGRFGQVAPQAVVVFSDGRARDPERAESIARGFGRMRIPIHVVPVGTGDVGGDVAIVSMVVPNAVRKSSRVPVQVFARSHGYEGKRAELKLVAIGAEGAAGAVLARTSILLRDGLFPTSLAFDSGDRDLRIEARVDLQPGEASTANNAFAADVAIDHTKIRVLYVEGATERYIVPAQAQGQAERGGGVRGAYSALQEALMEDPDIECTAVMPGGLGGDFSNFVRTDERARGLPETPSELFAYDAILLSNVPREALGQAHLAWIDEWIGRRGGGLCMAGGPNGFASGLWADTEVGRMLPVELPANGRDWDEALTTVRPAAEAENHPIWHITDDVARNRSILGTLPNFLGKNRIRPAKPGADTLAVALAPGRASGGETADRRAPAIAVQPYGRGRTMAIATAITRRWAPDFVRTWGEGDARYYKKFWRNVVYWLTENSSIGRRRLLAESDKRLYRPGEPIVIRARTFDENAAPTLDYRVTVSIEPKSAGDVASDDSPLRRPRQGAATSAEGRGALLPWGEEFDLERLPEDRAYAATLPIAEARSLPAGVALTQGLRIELTAYEDHTQVDSTALEVQVLDDPSEQQDPLPDHELLGRIAEQSGGRVLRDGKDLAGLLNGLPSAVGPPEIKRVPAWSRWWLLSLLIALLTLEWAWRRRLGLA